MTDAPQRPDRSSDMQAEGVDVVGPAPPPRHRPRPWPARPDRPRGVGEDAPGPSTHVDGSDRAKVLPTGAADVSDMALPLGAIDDVRLPGMRSPVPLPRWSPSRRPPRHPVRAVPYRHRAADHLNGAKDPAS